VGEVKQGWRKREIMERGRRFLNGIWQQREGWAYYGEDVVVVKY